MLLVHHYEAEPVEFHLLFDQRVRADDDIRPAVPRRLERLLPGGAREPAHQEDHGQSEGLQEVVQGQVVLARQDLGGRHQGALGASPHALQQRGGGDQGLAGPDVSLEQAIHRMGPAQVRGDLGDDAALSLRERKRQAGMEPGHELGRVPVVDRPRLGLPCGLLAEQQQFEQEELLVHEPPAGRGVSLQGVREVNLPERRSHIGKAVAAPQSLRQPLAHDRRRIVERMEHGGPEDPLTQPRRAAVDRDDPPDVKRLLAMIDELELRRRHLNLTGPAGDAPVQDDRAAVCEMAGEVGLIVPDGVQHP